MVLVTGATGLVGRHLLAGLIKQGDVIRALYRNEKKRIKIQKQLKQRLGKEFYASIAAIEWFKADILDVLALQKAFKRVSVVYHCAGLISYDVRDKTRLRKVNIEGTANMVNIALTHSVQKFCHLSSTAAMGQALRGKVTHENSFWDSNSPHNYYALSKYGAEMEVWRAAQEGLPVTIVNPGIIIGPGDYTSGSGRLFARVAKGFLFRLPKQVGVVGVDDVVRVLLKLTDSALTNERYILVAETLSMAALCDQIADALACKAPKLPLKKWMVVLLWLVQSTGYALLNTKKEVTRQHLKTLFSKTTYANSKIQKEIGFVFTPITKSIAQTAQDYLKQH